MKVCKNCNKELNNKSHFNRLYCNKKCSKKAEYIRSLENKGNHYNRLKNEKLERWRNLKKEIRYCKFCNNKIVFDETINNIQQFSFKEFCNLNCKNKWWYHTKIKTNPKRKLMHNLRIRLRHFLLERKYTKTKKMKIMLGCDLDFFKSYLEKQFDDKMNWDNYGSYWVIDHFLPLASSKNINEVYKLCYYSNLRPLEKLENISKGAKLIC